MRVILLLLPLLAACSHQSALSPNNAINPPGTERIYQRWQFSQARRAGQMLFISGQVGSEQNGVAEGLEAQSHRAFKNLQSVLNMAGADFSDLVEITTYHTDIGRIEEFMRIKAEYIDEPYPAWTALEVSRLAHPDFVIEIRATAVLSE